MRFVPFVLSSYGCSSVKLQLQYSSDLLASRFSTVNDSECRSLTDSLTDGGSQIKFRMNFILWGRHWEYWEYKPYRHIILDYFTVYLSSSLEVEIIFDCLLLDYLNLKYLNFRGNIAENFYLFLLKRPIVRKYFFSFGFC